MIEETKAKALVYKYLPELMELTFGCRYRYRCTGEVEYWYGLRYGGAEGRKKARDNHAKKVVRVTDKQKEWHEYNYVNDHEMYPIVKSIEGKWIHFYNYGNGTDEIRHIDFEILGHSIHLEHWITVLDMKIHFGGFFDVTTGTLTFSNALGLQTLHFNLKTGQPLAEEDFAMFNQIVSS